MEYFSHTPEETEKIAYEFAQKIKSGDVVCVYGEMGVGKSVFARGFAKGIGISEYIPSPTFTIVNEYSGKFTFYHFDVYRIEDPEDMYDIGFDEYIYGDGVSLIEWPELIEKILPEKRYNVRIDRTHDEEEHIRRIEIDENTCS